MNDLDDLRKSLDNIDNAIVYLLAERFRVTNKVGTYKAENDLPPVDKAREESQFARIDKLAKKSGLNPKFARNILRLIIDEVVKSHIQIQKKKATNG